MKRKQLKALPLPSNLKSTKHVGGKEFGSYYHNALYAARVDSSTGESILIIDLFNHKSGEFQRRFFFSENNWFSINNERTESARQFMGEWYYYFHDYKPITKYDALTVKEFFIENEYIVNSGYRYTELIKYAQRFCEEITEARKERGRENIKKRTERELAELKEPPKGFYSWIDKTATAEWKALFVEPVTKKTAKTKTGYCACCGKKVEVKRVRLGEIVKCPNCKTLCTAKSMAVNLNRGMTGFSKNVSYIEPLGVNRYCIREFQLFYNYWIGKSETGLIKAFSETKIYEFGRWFVSFDGNGDLIFEKGYKPSYDSRIGKWKKIKYYAGGKSMIYPRGLNKLFRSAPQFNLWHFDYEKVAKALHPIDPVDLYISSKGYRCLYNLFTNGFVKLCTDVISSYYPTAIIKRDYGSLKKALGLGKEKIKALAALNIGIWDLDLYKNYRGSGKKVSIDDFVDYLKIHRKINAGSEFFNNITKRSSLFKFNQYVNKQIAEKHIDNIKCFARDYDDYLTMANQLNYDLKNHNVLFPKNFQKAHDTLSKITADIEFKKTEVTSIRDRFPYYNQLFYYESADFLVAPPTCHMDLIKEGQELHHCVASYAGRVGRGETIILFIRKKSEPDKPFYTLNLAPKDYSQIQCRGLKNCATTKEVNQFLAEYRQKVISKLKRSIDKCRKTA